MLLVFTSPWVSTCTLCMSHLVDTPILRCNGLLMHFWSEPSFYTDLITLPMIAMTTVP